LNNMQTTKLIEAGLVEDGDLKKKKKTYKTTYSIKTCNAC